MIYGITNDAQFVPLIWSVLLGIACGVLWDMLRFLRRLLPSGRVRLFIEDVLFFVTWALLTFLLCYITNFGIVRAYILLAQPFGFFLWYCLPGRLTFRAADRFILLLQRFVFRPYIYLCRGFCLFSVFVESRLAEKNIKNKNKRKKHEKNILKLQKRTCKQKKDTV